MLFQNIYNFNVMKIYSTTNVYLAKLLLLYYYYNFCPLL